MKKLIIIFFLLITSYSVGQDGKIRQDQVAYLPGTLNTRVRSADLPAIIADSLSEYFTSTEVELAIRDTLVRVDNTFDSFLAQLLLRTRWKEDWSGDSTYIKGDIVQYDNELYIATTTTSSEVPGTELIIWKKITSVGTSSEPDDMDVIRTNINDAINKNDSQDDTLTILRNEIEVLKAENQAQNATIQYILTQLDTAATEDTLVSAPPAPIASADNDSAFVTVTIQPLTDPLQKQNYNIIWGRKPAITNWARLDTLAPEATTYTHESVISLEIWEYAASGLRSNNESSLSPPSNQVTVFDTATVTTPVPAAPTYLAAYTNTSGSTTTHLVQDNSAIETFYELLSSATLTGTYSRVSLHSTNISTEAIDHSPAITDTTIYYKWRAGNNVSTDTVYSSYSNALAVIYPVTADEDTFVFSQTYYLDADSGNNNLSGLDSANAWQTWSRVTSSALSPGTNIKIRRGTSYSAVTWNGNGTAGAWYKFSTYGTGALPKFGDSTSTTQRYGITNTGDYVIFDSLDISGSNYTTASQVGFYNSGDHVKVRYCDIEGGAARTNTIGIMSYNTVDLQIYDNDISYWGAGIEIYAVKPLDISYNYVHNTSRTDGGLSAGIRVVGTMASGGVYDYEREAVVHHNEVTLWTGEALNGSRAAGVIWEYNHLHDCSLTAYNGSAIKIGAWSVQTDGSYDMIFRYNIIHDLWAPQRASDKTWHANGVYGENMTDAEVYYNLFYNMYGAAVLRQGNGITAPATDQWEVHHNTMITGSSAIQTWGSTMSPTIIHSNVIKSGVQVSGKSYAYLYPRNSVETAQIWHGNDPYVYVPDGSIWDIRASIDRSSAWVRAYNNVLLGYKSIYDVKSSAYFDSTYGSPNLFGSGIDSNTVFSDYNNDDFTPKAGSPTIDYGVNTSQTTDLLGNSFEGVQDASAYDYQSGGGAAVPTVNIYSLSSPADTIIIVTGSCNANGASTTFRFKWGTSSTALDDSLDFNDSPISTSGNFVDTIYNLTAATKYYIKVSGTNSVGYSLSAVDSQTTAVGALACDPPAGDLFRDDRGCFEEALTYSWASSGGGVTITASTDFAYRGDYSLKVVGNTATNGSASIYLRGTGDLSTNLTVSQSYTITFKMRSATGTSPTVRSRFLSYTGSNIDFEDITVTDTWTEYTLTGLATHISNDSFLFSLLTTDETIYIDDLSIVPD